jgi:hypothetical protein
VFGYITLTLIIIVLQVVVSAADSVASRDRLTEALQHGHRARVGNNTNLHGLTGPRRPAMPKDGILNACFAMAENLTSVLRLTPGAWTIERIALRFIQPAVVEPLDVRKHLARETTATLFLRLQRYLERVG